MSTMPLGRFAEKGAHKSYTEKTAFVRPEASGISTRIYSLIRWARARRRWYGARTDDAELRKCAVYRRVERSSRTHT